MITIKRFKYLPYILIGVLGLIIAGASFYFLNNRYTDPIEMKDVVVSAREIPMYEVIRSGDLKAIQVPIDTNTGDYLVNYTDIVGKVSKIPLPSNELIAPDLLLDGEEVENITFMTINTLYAKTGGAKPGDIVDVYKVMMEKGDWVEGEQATLVAKDVVVISATTAGGKNIGEGNKLPLGGSERVEVIKLGVKPEDVRYLAPASVLVDNGYVLVVKSPYAKQEDTERDPSLDDVLGQNKEEEGGDLEDGKVNKETVSGKEKEGTGSR